MQREIKLWYSSPERFMIKNILFIGAQETDSNSYAENDMDKIRESLAHNLRVPKVEESK